jgi:hypothetical protein
MAQSKEMAQIVIAGRIFNVYTDPALIDMLLKNASLGGVTGDVTVTAAGVTSVGSGKITVDKLDPALLPYILETGTVETAKVGFSLVG